MIITRKLLVPTLVFFSIVLLGLVAYFVVTNIGALNSEENRNLNSMNLAFETNITSMADLAIALATNVANDPEIQASFAAGDRARLTELTMDSYLSLKGRYDIPQYQFSLSPAIVFLRLHQLDRYGDDVSATRRTVVDTNTFERISSGVELSGDGLSVRGVVPVYNLGSHIGSVEFGSRIDLAFLSKLKDQYGVDWHVMLRREVMDAARFAGEPGMTEGPIPGLLLQASTMVPPVFAQKDAYEKALSGQGVISRVESSSGTETTPFAGRNRSYAIMDIPLKDFSGNVIGVVDVVSDRTAAVVALRNRLILALAASLAGLILGGVILSFIIGRTLQPVQTLTETSAAIARGELDREILLRAPATGIMAGRQDEIERLAQSFNSMTQQLRSLVGNLEQRVAERTQQLERRSIQLRVAGEVAKDLTVMTDLDEILNQAVLLIRQRFDFYHAGVFLLDQRGEYAVLRAATGEPGRLMLERGHRLKVGEVGIVGAATGSGEPRIALDVGKDAVYFRNPLLPETRSEMALPLRVAGKIIGALDVQSQEEAAFDEEDVMVLQTMADQLAIAIQNANLIQQLNQTVRELEQTQGRFTRETWDAFIRQRGQVLGYRYQAGAQQGMGKTTTGLEPLTVQSSPARLNPEAKQALQQGQSVILKLDDYSDAGGEKQTHDRSALAVPIKLRDQVIGVLNLRFESEAVPPEMSSLVEEVTSRLGLVLESTRLLHDAQRLATREQRINWIATQVRSSVNLDTILQNTVRELGRTLGATRAYIQIGSEPNNSPEGISNPAKTHTGGGSKSAGESQ
jgi:nitrate/nitrite-specific signal transduction histidine kinase